jgi:hypothetical protein
MCGRAAGVIRLISLNLIPDRCQLLFISTGILFCGMLAVSW